MAAAAQTLKWGPWGGLATWSSSQVATWHNSWHNVRCSFSGLSNTFVLSSTLAVYLLIRQQHQIVRVHTYRQGTGKRGTSCNAALDCKTPLCLCAFVNGDLVVRTDEV